MKAKELRPITFRELKYCFFGMVLFVRVQIYAHQLVTRPDPTKQSSTLLAVICLMRFIICKMILLLLASLLPRVPMIMHALGAKEQ